MMGPWPSNARSDLYSSIFSSRHEEWLEDGKGMGIQAFLAWRAGYVCNEQKWCLQDILKPFLAACSVRSPKLASISLTSIQKLLAKGLLDHDDIQAIMQALEQVNGELLKPAWYFL